tara:strand:- start:65995 stop:66159 length:165 start_codon:yes stop_codon:yes gene_type:complete
MGFHKDDTVSSSLVFAKISNAIYPHLPTIHSKELFAMPSATSPLFLLEYPVEAG